jgi:hypothetical protein
VDNRSESAQPAGFSCLRAAPSSADPAHCEELAAAIPSDAVSTMPPTHSRVAIGAAMTSHLTPLNGNGHRRRLGRPLALYASPPEHVTAAAMDDEAAARQLVDDLLALVDAGLIVPIDDGDEIRYGPVDDDLRAA